jgi:hypothetical protein
MPIPPEFFWQTRNRELRAKMAVTTVKIEGVDHCGMSTLDLVFDSKTHTVPKKSVFELLQQQRLFDATSYAVQSSIPAVLFETFVHSLKTQRKMTVTSDNATSLSLLAKEFCLSDLAAECASFQSSADQFSSLSGRVFELERQVFSFSNPGRQLKEAIKSQERRLENLRLSVEKLTTSFRDLAKSQEAVPKPEKSLRAVELPMKEAEPLDGVISYLTKKHGGDVQEKGIVALTSKSADTGPLASLKDVVDLNSPFGFCSKSGPGQWVCWDFGEMRVRPTHYTIKCHFLGSWVVEGSLDGEGWTEIDRQTDSPAFNGSEGKGTFPVSKRAGFRFLRLTQTDTDRSGRDCVQLQAVEFFGTLFESL